MFVTQTCGFVLVAAAAPFVGGELLLRDLRIGALGGLSGVLGLLCFYHALAIGPMSVAAPFSAVLSAIVPFATGLVLGEQPGRSALLGAPLALVAVVLFSRPTTSARGHEHAGVSVVALSVAAGLGFGFFFVALDKVGDDSGIWPVVAARGIAVVAIVAALLATRTRPSIGRSNASTTVGAGIFDTLANVFVLLANRYGLLSIVAVVSSLYPAATVVLAQSVLHERFTRVHAAASVAALGAVVAFALA